MVRFSCDTPESVISEFAFNAAVGDTHLAKAVRQDGLHIAILLALRLRQEAEVDEGFSDELEGLLSVGGGMI